MKKKNKWYEVLGAGLLSVSAMYLCMSLVVTGCSSDNNSVTGGDTEEYSEVEEPAVDTEEKSEQTESSNSEEKSEQAESLNTEEVPEPAETSNPSEETESSNQSEGAGLAPQPDNVQSSDCFTKECEFIRDTITGFLMDLSVEDLFDVRGQFIERPDKEWKADEYGMDKED